METACSIIGISSLRRNTSHDRDIHYTTQSIHSYSPGNHIHTIVGLSLIYVVMGFVLEAASPLAKPRVRCAATLVRTILSKATCFNGRTGRPMRRNVSLDDARAIYLWQICYSILRTEREAGEICEKDLWIGRKILLSY